MAHDRRKLARRSPGGIERLRWQRARGAAAGLEGQQRRRARQYRHPGQPRRRPAAEHLGRPQWPAAGESAAYTGSRRREVTGHRSARQSRWAAVKGTPAAPARRSPPGRRRRRCARAHQLPVQAPARQTVSSRPRRPPGMPSLRDHGELNSASSPGAPKRARRR
ncbi:hypothetical protein ACPA9J_27140 [Pseudomonas aeruginosa]